MRAFDQLGRSSWFLGPSGSIKASVLASHGHKILKVKKCLVFPSKRLSSLVGVEWSGQDITGWLVQSCRLHWKMSSDADNSWMLLRSRWEVSFGTSPKKKKFAGTDNRTLTVDPLTFPAIRTNLTKNCCIFHSFQTYGVVHITKDHDKQEEST